MMLNRIEFEKKHADLENLQLLASVGDAAAQFSLGIYYQKLNAARSNNIHMTKAIEYYQLAARQGHAVSIRHLDYLGKLYFKLANDIRNRYVDQELLRLAADAGHPEAQYCLAKFSDKSLSPIYYRKAAEQNHPRAQCELAKCYYYGRDGIEINFQYAVKYFKSAAEQGDSDALDSLKSCYQKRLGMPAQWGERIQYYLHASQLGVSYASFDLACMYEKENIKEAVKYYILAAKQKHDLAPQKLYQLCQPGIEEQNPDKVHGLGFCYQYGYGVEAELKEAAKCFKIANDLGLKDAIDNLKIIYDGDWLKNFIHGKEIAAVYLYAMTSKTSESIAVLEKIILKNKKSKQLVEVSLNDSFEDIRALKLSENSFLIFKKSRDAYIKETVSHVNQSLQCESVSQMVCSYLINEKESYIAITCKLR